MADVPVENGWRNARSSSGDDLFRTLLEAAPDAMVIVDEGGKIILINAQTEEMFGYSRDELVGRSLEVLVPERFRGHHPEHRAEYVAHPRVRPMGAGLELAGRRRDGTEVEVDIRLSPIEVGGRALISASIRDVSRQKAQEQELQRARREAELASQSKSRFLAVASHDLRQPVQAAVNYLYVLRRQLGSEGREVAEKLQRALDTHCEQLDRLLDVSKLDAGRVRPEPTQIPLEQVFQRLGNELGPAAEAKGLELRIVPSSLSVTTDPLLLNQILVNLLSNAIRFTEQGRIVLGCRRSGAEVRIQVIDTGVGIPEDQLEHVFAEFYQVETTTPARRRGLGLGLSIVARLSELLDHPVTVRSELGRGSTFEVRVARAVCPGTALPAEESSDPTPTKPALLVLVEDEPDVLDSLVLILEMVGHEVIAGDTAAAVLAPLLRLDRLPDLILSDYQLESDLIGPQVIREIRDVLGAEIPAVLLTGDSSEARLDEAERSGFRLFSKPIDPAVLEGVLADLLRESRTD